MKVTMTLIVTDVLGSKGSVPGLEKLETKGQIETIVEIGQNAEKNPRDLRGLAITQNPVENHQMALV